MSPPPPPLPVRRPARRWAALTAILLFPFVVAAVFYGEENWRGARAWTACRRDLQSRGEQLDWDAFIPRSIPAERNLAMAPFFVRALRYGPDPLNGHFTFGQDGISDEAKGIPYGGTKPPDFPLYGWELHRKTDLARLQQFYREREGFIHPSPPGTPAADVLLALSRYAPALEELSQAAVQRSLTRFPVDWQREDIWGMRLPHFALEQHLVTALSLRASARLAEGQADDALADLELALRLGQDVRTEPTLLAHLMEITMLRLSLTPVWEGLAERRWAAAPLARLQAGLQRLDVLADYLSTVRGERVYNLKSLDVLQQRRDPRFLISVLAFREPRLVRFGPLVRAAVWAGPRGWFDLSKVTIARHEQDYFLAAADPATRRFLPEKLANSARVLEEMRLAPATFIPKFMLPVFPNVARRSARLQAGLDQAASACALERYFLDHGVYPEHLAELTPAYLDRPPTDIISGEPLRYRRTADGRYRLYGVGWNGRDDAGQVVWDSSTKLKDTEGDWVWQYASLQPPPPLPAKKN